MRQQSLYTAKSLLAGTLSLVLEGFVGATTIPLLMASTGAKEKSLPQWSNLHYIHTLTVL